MSHKRHCLSLLGLLCIASLAAVAHAAGPWAVSSPDGKLTAEIRSDPDGWFIQMQRSKDTAVPASPIAITSEKAGLLPGYLGYPRGPTPTYDVNLVFTRNVAGSMDYTPTTFDLPGATATSRRISTSAHEMALAVVFESGWQSMGVNPNSMRDNPAAEFLTGLPTAWDDVRLVDGRPGEFAVIARRKGADWWLAGINAEKPVELKLSLDFIRPGIYATALFKDQDAESASGLEFVITNNGGINAVVSWIELWSTAKPAVEVPWQRPAAMDAAPAGFYLVAADNCGTAAGAKHLLKATGDNYTWGPNDVPLDVLPTDDPARSLHFRAKELKYRFPGLDKSQNYILRMLYSNNHEARTQSHSCNGRELHGPLQLPTHKVLCRSFRISGKEMRPLPGPEPLDTKIVAEPLQVDTTKAWTIKVPARGGFGLILRNSYLSEQ